MRQNPDHLTPATKPGICRAALLVLLLIGAAPAFSQDAPAQEAAAPAPPRDTVVRLPDRSELALAITRPATRYRALAALLVIDELLQKLDQAPDPLPEEQLDEWLLQAGEDWNWLLRLQPLQRDVPRWSPRQDLSSLILGVELRQHDLRQWQDLQHANEQFGQQARRLVLAQENASLSAALLPTVLSRAQVRLDASFSALSTLTGQNGSNLDAGAIALRSQVLAGLPLSLWQGLSGQPPATPAAATPPPEAAPLPVPDYEADADWVRSEIEALFARTVLQPLEDRERLRGIHMGILMLEQVPATELSRLLAMSALLEYLAGGRYLFFAEGLVDLAACAVDQRLALAGPLREPADAALTADAGLCGGWVSDILLEYLPGLSSIYAKRFADVDGRINSALADVVSVLSGSSGEGRRDAMELMRELANAQARLLLMAPDAGYYFEQPVRQRVREEIDICTSIAGSVQSGVVEAISVEQFNGCIDSFVSLVEDEIRNPALAGDRRGPFGQVQMRRELALIPWQRINYTLGYLDQQYGQACQLSPEPLINPLEWAQMVGMMRWFADQWPVYFQSAENENRLQRVRAAGEQLLRGITQRSRCLAGQGEPLRDVTTRLLDTFEQETTRLVDGLNAARADFRVANLAPGADIRLNADAQQLTRYRPEALTIGPCRASNTCEMSQPLEATRGLVDLFPEPFLIADQSRLGRIEICYDNVRWIDRKSVPTREDVATVANFHGRFAFDLIGRYLGADEQINVFTKRFVSPDEYPYLFSANDLDTLNDPCPMSRVGTAVVTELTNSALPIVPNRLTYLTAARTLPSRLFADNWASGAEWRDWFVTGDGIETVNQDDGSVLVEAVDAHLQQLYRDLQGEIYGALLAQPRGAEGGTLGGLGAPPPSLADLLAAGSEAKMLLRSAMLVHYPNQLLFNDAIRAAFEGSLEVVDRRAIRRLRDAGVPLEALPATLRQRQQALVDAWLAQPAMLRRQGSVTPGMALAWLHLDYLQSQYFGVNTLSQAEVVQPPQDDSDLLVPLAVPVENDALDGLAVTRQDLPVEESAETVSAEPDANDGPQ